MQNPFKLAVIALASALVSSCASPVIGSAKPGADAAAPRPDDGQATLRQIRTLVGEASCTASSECHTLALGARPCGGPEAYLPWSSAQTQAQALNDLAQRYRQERAASHAASGVLSDCRVIRDPGAVCQRRPGTAPAAAGTCVPPDANGAR